MDPDPYLAVEYGSESLAMVIFRDTGTMYLFELLKIVIFKLQKSLTQFEDTVCMSFNWPLRQNLATLYL